MWQGERASLGPSSYSSLSELAYKLERCWLEEKKGVWQAECNHTSVISFGKQACQKVHSPFFLEGFLSTAARSLKKTFIPLGLSYHMGTYVTYMHLIHWLKSWVELGAQDSSVELCCARRAAVKVSVEQWAPSSWVQQPVSTPGWGCARGSQPSCSWRCEKCCCSKIKLKVVVIDARVRHTALKSPWQRSQGSVLWF